MARPEELIKLQACATEFHQNSQLLARFDWGVFLRNWTNLILSETGVVFLVSTGDKVTGTLGAIVHPDINSDDLVAQEAFWYVLSDSRGDGLKLYRAFERWARSKGCKVIRIGHLLDSMPEKLQRFYSHQGYVATEVNYAKRLG